jgi:hypothetical protein
MHFPMLESQHYRPQQDLASSQHSNPPSSPQHILVLSQAPVYLQHFWSPWRQSPKQHFSEPHLAKHIPLGFAEVKEVEAAVNIALQPTPFAKPL